MDLERIHDYCWRIPKHGKMRVDGIIYASKGMLDAIREDESLKQVENVACLPGIIKASMAMPDIHWGYGFPIGGVAAFDMEEGIISPGGVGYDINCLPNYAESLDFFGCRRSMESYKDLTSPPKLPCLVKKEGLKSVPIRLFLERQFNGKLTQLTTESGKVLQATPEHPVLTPQGMVRVDEIAAGEEVAIYHFQGIPYESPSEKILVREEDIVKLLKQFNKDGMGNAIPQVINFLKKINLLPLRYDSPQLPYLLRIMGFLFGDGTLYLESGRKRLRTAFYGKKEDLELIRDDIRAVGFTPSPIHSRHRQHFIKTNYNNYYFNCEEHSFFASGTAFGALLLVLGVPLGKKTDTNYEVPNWIFEASLWQKRLFLAALFGAELNTPNTLTGYGYNFYCPVLDMSKREDFAENGIFFLRQISEMLSEFGVKTLKISTLQSGTVKKGANSCRLRLILSDRYENLVNLYSKIGFEYNRRRQARAAQAVAYLKCKEQHLQLREQLAENICAYAKATGTDGRSAYTYFADWVPNKHFVERSIKGRSWRVRVGGNFPTFDDFVHDTTEGIENSGCVWERVIAIDEEGYHGPVYDFTVGHPAHNFIADGFVVSNCGVRLLRTELDVASLDPKKREVINQLFRDIPTGVGSRRRDFKLGSDDLKRVLKEGARWAVEHGYGEASDLDHIEAGGCIPGADPSAVSDRAKTRGKDQLGTLGSGNHFVEVEEVVEIYDEQAANVMGLFKGQITLHVHTGSRGLGHQVCSDHIELMLQASRKYGIELPDKQLCCTPINSLEGKHYFAAMAAAANFAFANRQMITYWVRRALEHSLHLGPADLGITPIYDVCHNIAKFEEHMIGNSSRKVCVHRKGATRAFPPGHPEVPSLYRKIGQPVLIPGDMGRYSFVLVGTQKAMEETFGSTCHGAGRIMSRHAAKRACRGRDVARELETQGIIVRGASRGTIVEEMPEAYKDVAAVVDAVHNAGISKKVAMLKPLGVIKG